MCVYDVFDVQCATLFDALRVLRVLKRVRVTMRARVWSPLPQQVFQSPSRARSPPPTPHRTLSFHFSLRGKSCRPFVRPLREEGRRGGACGAVAHKLYKHPAIISNLFHNLFGLQLQREPLWLLCVTLSATSFCH